MITNLSELNMVDANKIHSNLHFHTFTNKARCAYVWACVSECNQYTHQFILLCLIQQHRSGTDKWTMLWRWPHKETGSAFFRFCYLFRACTRVCTRVWVSVYGLCSYDYKRVGDGLIGFPLSPPAIARSLILLYFRLEHCKCFDMLKETGQMFGGALH